MYIYMCVYTYIYHRFERGSILTVVASLCTYTFIYTYLVLPGYIYTIVCSRACLSPTHSPSFSPSRTRTFASGPQSSNLDSRRQSLSLSLSVSLSLALAHAFLPLSLSLSLVFFFSHTHIRERGPILAVVASLSF